MKRIRLPAKIENLQKFLDVISNFVETNHFSPDAIMRIKLSVEEALVNILNYAYPGRDGEVEVTYRKQDDTKLFVEIQIGEIQQAPDDGFDQMVSPSDHVSTDSLDRVETEGVSVLDSHFARVMLL